MKLFEVAYTTLYHRMSKVHYSTLKTTGEFALKRGTLCATHDRSANKDQDFGEILLALDVKKLLERNAKIVELTYTVDWLEKNSLLKHVTGMSKAEWLEYVGDMDADEELKEAYGHEKEVVIYIDRILLTEVKKL